eukprot:1728100-Rhodomonas_salina.1
MRSYPGMHVQLVFETLPATENEKSLHGAHAALPAAVRPSVAFLALASAERRASGERGGEWRTDLTAPRTCCVLPGPDCARSTLEPIRARVACIALAARVVGACGCSDCEGGRARQACLGPNPAFVCPRRAGSASEREVSEEPCVARTVLSRDAAGRGDRVLRTGDTLPRTRSVFECRCPTCDALAVAGHTVAGVRASNSRKGVIWTFPARLVTRLVLERSHVTRHAPRAAVGLGVASVADATLEPDTRRNRRRVRVRTPHTPSSSCHILVRPCRTRCAPFSAVALIPLRARAVAVRYASLP